MSGGRGELEAIYELYPRLSRASRVQNWKNSRLSLFKVLKNKQRNWKVVINSFHLDGYTLAFHQQTQILKPPCKKKGKGKGNLFYVKNTGSGCPSLPSQVLMIEVFDIHVKRKKKKKKDLKTIY